MAPPAPPAPWPDRDPVGLRIVDGRDTLEIVGVARDVKYRVLREEAGPSFYVPLGRSRPQSGVIPVRTTGDPRLMLDTLRRALTEVDAAVPITTVRTLRDQATLNLNDERLAMIIGVALGGAAGCSACVPRTCQRSWYRRRCSPPSRCSRARVPARRAARVDPVHALRVE